MMSVLEDVFRSILIKRFGTDENFDVIINVDKGDFEIWRNRVVVADGEVGDPNLQISLTEAKKIDEDYEIGEDVTDEVKLEDFGRRAILSLRQNLTSRILELEKDHVYSKYKDKIGDVITGEVYQVWNREILILDDEGNELILPKSEQIPSDFFRKGDTLRARDDIIASLRKRDENKKEEHTAVTADLFAVAAEEQFVGAIRPIVVIQRRSLFDKRPQPIGLGRRLG